MISLKHVLVVAVLSGATWAISAEAFSYATGDNLLVNGDFSQLDKNGTPRGWKRNVQLSAKAVLRVASAEGLPGGGNAAEIFFTEKEGSLQARYFQSFDVKTNTVYELMYWYCSDVGASLNADIMLTGTGPLYRLFKHAPSPQWTLMRRLFATPAKLKQERGVMYVQNRSQVPIRYAAISLKETDVSPTDLAKFAPTFTVHSVTPDDQLILPGGGKTTADFVIQGANDRKDKDFSAALVNGNGKRVDVAVVNRVCHVPMEAVADGKSRLSVFLKGGDGAVVSTGAITLEKIAESALAGDILPADPPCFVNRAGRPTLVIGMYGIDVKTPQAELRELAENGFNFIHSYAFDSSKDKKAIEGILAKSANAGISCMVGLPRRFAEKKGKSVELEDWIKALDQSPQTEFYYEDEMYTVRKTSIDLFKQAKNVVSSVSGNKRLFFGYEPPENFLAPYLDGFMWGFALPNGSKLARIRVGPEKIFLHVFGQGHYDRLEERVSDELVRYNFFMPMILGARGVFYWWYPTVRFKHKYRDELKDSLFATTKELRALEPWILSNEQLPNDAPKVSVTGNSIYCLERVVGDECVIIAGCDISATKGGRVAVNPAGFPQVDGETSFNLAPGGIRILRLRRTDAN